MTKTKTPPEQSARDFRVDNINFAEEQDKDKYCKTARDKYEKACKKQ